MSQDPSCGDEAIEEAPVQTKPLADQITPLVQRQTEEEEEEPIQEKSVDSTLLQRQPEEEEEEEEEEVQPKLIDGSQIQRQEEEEEEEPIQTKPLSGSPSRASPGVQSQIRSLRGGGQPLPQSSRAFFESRFGRDFSDVRVHADSRAAETAKSINAKAFTTGKNVVFGPGQYSPNTTTGKSLLAHELTHVLQQNNTLKRSQVENSTITGVKYSLPLVAQKINKKIIQRVQTARPTTGSPYFKYELDSTRNTYSHLASYYGLRSQEVSAANPGRSSGSLSIGDEILVPALHVPPAQGGVMGGSGNPGLAVGSSGRINIRWNNNAGSNKIGQLNRGSSIPEIFGVLSGGYRSLFVDPANLLNQAEGIVIELQARGLVSGPASIGNYVLGYGPDANIIENTLGSSNAQKALAVALSEYRKNVTESPNCSNRGPDIDKYTGTRGASPVVRGNSLASGVCGPAWCAYFVKWCFNQAGISLGITGRASTVTTWNTSLYHLLSATTPIPGDIFFIAPSSSSSSIHPCDDTSHPCILSGGSGHVGFIYQVSGNQAITIEGNIHIPNLPAGLENDGIVMRTRNFSELQGVLRIP